MANLSLRISIVERNVIKTMQFDPLMNVFDACRLIREKYPEANLGQPQDYGLFLADEDDKKGVWLEPGRNLEYYILRNGDLLEYRKKMRTLKVHMLDGTVKTMMVDDSQPVVNLMVVICTKIGITNHDEYSLVRETPEDEVDLSKPNYGTLTLKRKKEEKEKDAKMIQLRKKLKTDDEINWINPAKTLREQGIDENEPVLLRRKFFFSDGNIDTHDPIQLNLLYVQCRDAILDGTHPVTQDLACQLAGIQAHIQFGNYNEMRHKPPFLELKEFLPQSYIKVKGIEKKIFQEHAKHIDKSELDAKVLYTKTARSLPTYGVTFFLVKEKMQGKNKLVPRLFGVTKDAVLRLDEKTKEILKVWPLTSVRRWAASPNTFTLDFGDYSDGFYCVQTIEAEQILQLIAGYIDILLKKKAAKDHFGIEGDEGSTMVEDSVSPLRATILQHESTKVGKVNTESVAKPAVMRAGADGARPYGMGHVGTAQYTTISGQINIAHTPPATVQQSQVTTVQTGPHKALLSTITAGHEIITTVEKELISKAIIPELGTDSASLKWKETTLDTNKQNVSHQIAAMNAATAQVVSLTSGETDYTSINAAITSITSNLPEMSRGVRVLAALAPEKQGDQLLDAARQLCTAFSDLLKACASHQPRQAQLLSAASRVGEASQQVLTVVGDESSVSREQQDTLLGLAKAVANTTAALVLKAKSVAATLPNDHQSSVIAAAAQCALATSQLVACTKVVVPTLENSACQEQLTSAVKEVTRAVETLVLICNESCNEPHLMEDLKTAASQVTYTLEQLLNHIKPVSEETVEETIMITSERLIQSTDPNEMLRQAKLLGQATAHLIESIKGEAENEYDINSDKRTRLLAAAKVLAEATARMVEAARACASAPSDVAAQSNLKQAVEELRVAAVPSLRSQTKISITETMTEHMNGSSPPPKEIDDSIMWIGQVSEVLYSNNLPKTDKTYTQLQQELHSTAISMSTATNEVISSVNSPKQLASASKQMGSAFSNLVEVGMEIVGSTPEKEVREQMLSSLKTVSASSSQLLSTAKTVSEDPDAFDAKMQLTNAARAVTESINNLIDVCTSAAPGQKECNNAVRNIQAMKPLLNNPVEPINDSSYFECLDTIMDKSMSLGDGMSGILKHAKRSEHDEFGTAVRAVSDAVCGLTEAAVQSAYLVAISTPGSVAGERGLIDQAQLSRASQAISQACQTLSNRHTSQQEVLSAATVIAKHTSSLCNACRVASSKTTNPAAKRLFVQSAKDVANSTANLVKDIKALDVDYSDRNRESCAAATRPLLDAVNSLVSFASSSEFASRPAHISEAAFSAQEPILSAGETIIDATSAMILAAKSLVITPKDPPTWQFLANHSKNVSDSVKKLVAYIRDKAPGQRECEDGIERCNELIRELDQATLSSVSHHLAPPPGSSLENSAEETEYAVTQIVAHLEPLRSAAKSQAEKLGHEVEQILIHLKPLTNGAIGVASHLVHSKQQVSLLDQTKTVIECVIQLLYSAKDAGGNPKVVNKHEEVDECVTSTKEALSDLTEALEQNAGVVRDMIDSITQSMRRIPDSHQPNSYILDSTDSYVNYHTRMVASAKDIARLSQEIATRPGYDSHLSQQLTQRYSELTNDCVGIVACTTNPDVMPRLSSAVHDLGTSCIATLKASSAASNDSFARRELTTAAKNVTDKVAQVLRALQAGSRGTQACINAANTVSGIIGDLDATIMFATAGTLHAENDSDTFADHRELILKTARALVEDTKTLVAGAASSQEQLAVAAQNAVSTIVQLAEVVKFGAASLGSNNPEAQVMLINSVKDVASALGDLIHATKAASGKNIEDPCMKALKESAKVMVVNVTSLLKTVKAVEDEHARGTRALESTIEAIAQEIRALNSVDLHKSVASPEDLLRSTKPVTMATAKAVAAGNSGKQEDVIVAANMGRKAISDMLTICKGCANAAETADLKRQCLETGQNVALQYRELLQMLLHSLSRPGNSTTTAKQTLPPISRRIAQGVTDLVTLSETLKGSDWVNPEDPTVIAENELFGAAASIDAAARKLASLRPRKSAHRETDESLNFDEMILEAAKSIAAATSALLKSASAAQRELYENGRVSRRPLSSSDDGQWSEGLVSAAQLVAAATHSLVEAANALVQGLSSEEKLISAAKQVAYYTAQLLVACKVKADPDSDSTKRLQAAGNAVKRATDNLVKAAQQAIQHDEEHSLVLNQKMVGGIAQEINARSEVLRIEKELDEARGRLTAIKQAKYKKTGDSPELNSDCYDSSY